MGNIDDDDDHRRGTKRSAASLSDLPCPLDQILHPMASWPQVNSQGFPIPGIKAPTTSSSPKSKNKNDHCTTRSCRSRSSTIDTSPRPTTLHVSLPHTNPRPRSCMTNTKNLPQTTAQTSTPPKAHHSAPNAPITIPTRKIKSKSKSTNIADLPRPRPPTRDNPESRNHPGRWKPKRPVELAWGLDIIVLSQKRK